MKRLIMIGLILLTIFITSESAFSWHRPHYHHRHGSFGIFIAPPSIWIAPPAIYFRGYYPPPSYYDRYYDYPNRVWIPGHWEERWTPYGWERVWIPGYWRYVP